MIKRSFAAAVIALGLGATAIAQVPPNMGGMVPNGGASSGSSTGSLPGYTNLDAALNPQLSKCIANVTSGAAKCTIIMGGDSTVWGEGSGTGGAASGNVNLTSFPTQFAKRLNAIAIPAHQDGFCGATGAGGDSRITFTGGWANGGFFNTIGGASYSNSTDTTGIFSFAPINTVDTFKITYNTQFSGQGGSFESQIDTGSFSAPVDTAVLANRGIASTTVTTTPGTHTVNIKRSGTGTGGGNQVSIVCIEAWNSAVPSISIINAGWPGAAISNWIDASSGGAPLPALVAYAADVVAMDIGINDETQNGGLGDLTAFVPNYQTFISALYSPPFTCTVAATIVANSIVTCSNPVPSTIAAGMIPWDLSATMPPGAGFAPNHVISSTGTTITLNSVVSALQGDLVAFYAPSGLFLYVPTPIAPIGFVPQSTQDAFTKAINALGVTNSLSVIDLAHLFVNWTQQEVLGMQWDDLHPNALGYGRVAGATTRFIILGGQ